MSLYKDMSGPVWGFRALALLIAALLLLQPVLIGQYLARPEHTGYKDVHAAIGDILMLLALILVVFAFLSRRTFGIGMTFHCLAMFVLVFIQTFLGHDASDGGANSKAIHIPLGVLLFGMGSYIPFLAFFDLKAQRSANQPNSR